MANTKAHRKKRNKVNFLTIFIPLFLILFGSVFIFWASAGFINAPFFLNPVKTLAPAGFSVEQNAPKTLYIPKIGKVLAISPGQVVDNRWVISETGVSYLTTTPLPGSSGNSVLYGHNKWDILGRLVDLKPGDIIYVVSQKGDIAKYTVFETKEVTPNQVEILNNTSDSRLTIYTCTGFLDSARFVVVARLG